MMTAQSNMILMKKYGQIVNEHFETNPIVQSWRMFMKKFFNKHSDPILSIMKPLAMTFENIDNPDYFRIESGDIQMYFKYFNLSNLSLVGEGFRSEIGFFEDENSLRISFRTMKSLIFSHGNKTLIDMFWFLSAFYSKYTSIRATQDDSPIYWTLSQRTNQLTRTEISYSIMKKGVSPQNDKKRKSSLSIPVFKKVLTDIEEEISAVISHFKYMSRKNSKCGISVKGMAIVVDLCKNNFNIKDLCNEIENVRKDLMNGKNFKKLNSYYAEGSDVLKNIELRIAQLNLKKQGRDIYHERVDGWGCVGIENEDEPSMNSYIDVKKLRCGKYSVATRSANTTFAK